jgi:hypothetical protein
MMASAFSLSAAAVVALVSATALGQDHGARLGQLSCAAGEIAKFDGSRWICAPDNAGSDQSLVLRDNAGQVFGIVVDFAGGAVTVIEEFIDPSSGNLVSVSLQVFPDGVVASGELFFPNDDCSGVGWIRATSPSNGFPNIFQTSTVVGDGFGTGGDVRRLYAAPDNTIRQIVTGSVIFGLNACFDLSGSDERLLDVREAELIDADLHTLFPPPYTLNFE